MGQEARSGVLWAGTSCVYDMGYTDKRKVLQLWAVEPQLRFIRKYIDHLNHGRFIIQCDFAAVKDRFVMSGSQGMSHPKQGGPS